MAKKTNLKIVPQELKLDFGCGPNKAEGFIGVDQYAMKGVDVVLDIGKDRWPWDDNSIQEARASHFLEHLQAQQRVHFFNELYRVLKPGSKASIITPHWCSNRAYGDFTHQWPPVSEMLYYYISKEWRATQAPHTDKQWNTDGYDCDFAAVWGYGMSNAILSRNAEYQQYALANYKEAAQDLHATIEARK